MAPILSSMSSSHRLAEDGVPQPGLIPRSLLSASKHAINHIQSSSIFARIFSTTPATVHLPDTSSSSSSSSTLARREVQMISIPSTYNGPTPSPAIVVAIVLGTVTGFIFVLCIISYIIGGMRPPPPDDFSDFDSRRSRSHRSRSRRSRSHRSRSRRPRRPEVVEVEYSETRSSHSMSDDDIVEVFEELDSPPESPGRTYNRRSGGYRTVDPREYGGGRHPRRSGRR